MNVLLVSSRFPWPSYTGDRMRASIWLDALAPHARIALVAPPGDVPSRAPAFRFFPAPRAVANGARGALRVLREGLPIQSLLAAPFDWNGAIDAARRELGPFDATIVILSRVDPWIRGFLDDGPRILDSIDSLRRNTSERADAAAPLVRWFWRHEESRLARVERELGHAYDRVVVVSEDETSEFDGGAMAIANSVRIAPLDAAAPRRYDFGFWGRLAYFANLDAAQFLLREIVPALRALHPTATIALGGADAPRSLQAMAERAGIDIVSPIADVPSFARNVRVAIVPMRFGSGQSSKLLEAAEAGCAIVTTPAALRGLPRLAPHAAVASDAHAIASTAVALLRDDVRRNSMSTALRRAVEQHHARERVLAAMADLAGVSKRAKAVSA